MSSVAMVQGIAPQFTDTVAIEDALEEAADAHTAANWGRVYARAMAYYAAHLLEMRRRAAALGTATGGALTSIKTGDLAIGFAAPGASSSGSPLEQTWYGQQYLELVKSRAAGKARTTNL